MKEKYNYEFPMPNPTMGDFVSAYMELNNVKVVITYPQEMHVINLDLTAFCNLTCYSCNHFMDSAPSSEMMTLEQIRAFVDESIEMKWIWKELRLTGGEPTLHPQFYEILDEVKRLKTTYLPDITLKVISNGTGDKVRQILKMDESDIEKINQTTCGFTLKDYPDWQVMSSLPLKQTIKKMTLEDGRKVDFIDDFGNVFLAPFDRLDKIGEYYNLVPGGWKPETIDGYLPATIGPIVLSFIIKNNAIMDCQVHATCGFELTPYGYTPCPCGGHRVVGDESVFFKSLKEITQEKCVEILAKMCSMCGRNMNYATLCKTDMKKSPFWELVLENYKENKPQMSLYNEANLVQISSKYHKKKEKKNERR